MSYFDLSELMNLALIPFDDSVKSVDVEFNYTDRNDNLVSSACISVEDNSGHVERIHM